MKILLTGSSGLIGTALMQSLSSSGHELFRMSRSRPGSERFCWQPSENEIHFDETAGIDAVINLAGASIADGRWNERRKKQILESRVTATTLLSNTLAQMDNKPGVLISGSAIGIYGDAGDRVVDENSPPGSGFLADVAQQWENATGAASAAGIRTVTIRTGVVLSAAGGALRKMLLPFKMGLGGVVGNGKQYMSWVSMADTVNMISFILEHEALDGPVNLVSRTPVPNRTFTKTLASVLRRPAMAPLPEFAVRRIFGEMADDILLSSIRAKPKKLEDAGYRFVDDDLEAALRSLLNRESAPQSR